MPKKKSATALPIADVEAINAQNRLAKMMEKSGYQSKMLDKLAGKRKPEPKIEPEIIDD
jgi:hypothetical protein